MNIVKLSDAIEYAIKKGIYAADGSVLRGNTNYMCCAMSIMAGKQLISYSQRDTFRGLIQDHVNTCAKRMHLERGVDSPLITTMRYKKGNMYRSDYTLYKECEKHYKKWVRDLKRRGK
mgnify:CR=1 FL=1